MITHVIYHIPGRKVGCTKNFEYRKASYRQMEGIVPEGIAVLEELHDKTDQEAGDIEWRWADEFGYFRGAHYAATNRVEAGRKSAQKLNELGLNGFKNMDMQKRVEVARRGGITMGRKAVELRLGVMGLPADQRRLLAQRSISVANGRRGTCPHCGVECSIGNLARWHLDRCRHRRIIGFSRGN